MLKLFDLLGMPIPHSSQDKKLPARKMAVIDAETDPFKKGRFPHPFIWGFFDGDSYDEFTTIKELLDYMEDYPVPLRVYAHNGGKFDYHFMLEYLEAGTEIMIINGRLSKFKIGNIEFRDSYNLFNFPLSSYKKDAMDYTIMEKSEREKPHNREKISKYLRKDCEYLYELINGFIGDYGLHLSQAGAAMKVWSKMSGIKPPRSDAQYYDDIVPYYYGGRVECFVNGIIKKPFKMIDITSAYPYAMYSDHPFSLSYKVFVNKKAINLVNKHGGLLAEVLSSCFFKIQARSKGALPFRDKTKDKLLFPDDNILRLYTVTGWEVQAGIRTGTLTDIKVLSIKKWDELINFKEYVDRFFKMKSEAKESGNRLDELFAKLFLNALYGKWAANPRSYKNYTLTYPDEIDRYKDQGYDEGGFLGQWHLATKPLTEERQRFYNVATAASITGFVRAYLWEAACKCEGLLYCDTDSIAAYNIDKIDLSKELGGWDLDGDFGYGGIGGRKMYAFRHVKKPNEIKHRWKTASKGARLSHNEIIKVAKGYKVTYSPIAPTYSVHKSPRFTNREIVKT